MQMELIKRNKCSGCTACANSCPKNCIKMIPDEDIWNTFTGRLRNLINKYPFVRLDYYGFTDEWEKIIGIID